jgi:c-di-GMP-binding flagellar brake protein YcgR
MERRSYPRFSVSHPALYLSDVYPRATVASTLDLSLGGTRIKIPHSLIAGERLAITIVIHHQPIMCRAKTIYVAWLDKGKIEAGLQFEELSPHDKRCLTQYLSGVTEHRASLNNGEAPPL